MDFKRETQPAGRLQVLLGLRQGKGAGFAKYIDKRQGREVPLAKPIGQFGQQ